MNHMVRLVLFSIFFVADGAAGDMNMNGPAAAYIQQIAVDHENPDILYVATIGAGLFKSTTGGLHWYEINADAGFKRYYAVVVDPENASRVFAGGENTGLWLSEDRGETWQRIGLESVTICEMSIDRTDPSRIFLLAPGGVYRNNDILNCEFARSFAVDPERINIVYAGTNVGMYKEDSLVDPLYQRPPYVSIQLVSDGYPCDKSLPVWEKNFERYLKGTVQIPKEKLSTNKNLMLYAEVRDFQRNVLIGSASVSPTRDSSVTIHVAPDVLPPCLK
jgi:hypothetical protein